MGGWGGVMDSQMDNADDDVHQAEMVSAATFLHTLLAGGKATINARPLVYSYKSTEDAAEDDQSDSDRVYGGHSAC